MLKYTDISLFDSPAQTLVNTVNTVGVMGKGIALEFKRRYPEMFKRYKELCEKRQLDIGKLYVYRTDHHWVLNFPTKKHWRRPSEPEFIEKGLQKFVAAYTSQGIISASFPQLGCGNGGLDWDGVVRPMMEKYLGKLPIPIYVHAATPQSDFVPEHKDKKQLSAFQSELRQPREPISFARFFDDIQIATGVEPVPILTGPREEFDPLPSVRIIDGRRELVLAGEDFAELWHTLVQRGAIARSELPGDLGDAAEPVLRLLERLEYVQPMRLGDDDGVRFVPRASQGMLAVRPARES